MSLSIFLVLSQYEVSCKCRIISQMSIYKWMQHFIFQYLWYCIFIFFKLNYNLLPQIRWLSHDELRALSSAQMAILHRTSSGRQLKSEKKEMDQDRILTHSRFNGTLRIWIVLLRNSQLPASKKWMNKKKHLTINNIKLSFLNKSSSVLYPVKHHLKYRKL